MQELSLVSVLGQQQRVEAGVAGGQLARIRPIALHHAPQGAQAADWRTVRAGEELEEFFLLLEAQLSSDYLPQPLNYLDCAERYG